MKRENLFRFNLENEDSTIEHEALILRSEREELHAKRHELTGKFVSTLVKGVFNVYVVLMFVFGALGLASIGAAATDYFETKTLSVLTLGVALLFLALAGVCAIIHKVKFGNSKEDEELDSIDDALADLEKTSRSELGVPDNATVVDVFVTTCENDPVDEPYSVDEFSLFEEDGKLCLYYSGDVIAVPIAGVEEVVKIDDEILFENWNKDASHDSAEYAEYQIVERKTDDDDEVYAMNGYYSIRFANEGEHFEILVPSYDIKPFLDVLHLEVSEA